MKKQDRKPAPPRAKRRRDARRNAATAAHPPRRTRDRDFLFALGLLTLAVALAYGNTLWNGFVYDDHHVVEHNNLIRSLRNVPALFTTHYWQGAVELSTAERYLYRPLVHVSYAINYAVSGLSPWAYHLVNVLCHLFVTLTLYLLGRILGLGLYPAMGAALIFAVHPLNSEAVGGIVGRAELLMVAGVLWALLLDLRRNPMDEPPGRVSIFSGVAFLCGLLAKEQAVMFPALLLVCDGLRGEGGPGAGWWQKVWQGRLRYLLYLSLLCGYVVLRLLVLGEMFPPDISVLENPIAKATWWAGVLTAVRIAGLYLWLVIWPVQLAADYSYSALPLSLSPAAPGVFFGVLAWSGLMALGVLAWVRRNLPLSIGIAITGLFFLPVANLLFPIGTIMGERLFYLPLAGLCLALGAGLEWLGVQRGTAGGALPRFVLLGVMALAVLLGARTVRRNRDWANDYTLFQSAVAVNPRAAKSRFLLGSWLRRMGREADALRELEKARAIYPDYQLRASFVEETGQALISEGRAHEALALVKTALSQVPGDPALLHVAGLVYQTQERWEEAEAAHQRALKMTQERQGEQNLAFVDGLYKLARVYAMQQKYTEADRLLERALLLLPRVAPGAARTAVQGRMLAIRAMLYYFQEDYGRAEPLFVQLFSLVEKSPQARDLGFVIQPLQAYAELLNNTGRVEQAGEILRRIESLSRTEDG